MCIYRYNVLSTFYVQTYIPYVYMHIVCICIYMYIYIYTRATPLTTKIHVNFCWPFHLLAAGAVSWPRNGIHCSGCSWEVGLSTHEVLVDIWIFVYCIAKKFELHVFVLRISALFDSFLGPVLWGLQDIDSIAKIYLKKEPPPKKPGLGPCKPMYMGGNINFPRTWYGDWMMFQCVSGGSTLVCIVSFRCCSESWLHWPLNLLNTVSSGNLRVI